METEKETEVKETIDLKDETTLKAVANIILIFGIISLFISLGYGVLTLQNRDANWIVIFISFGTFIFSLATCYLLKVISNISISLKTKK